MVDHQNNSSGEKKNSSSGDLVRQPYNINQLSRQLQSYNRNHVIIIVIIVKALSLLCWFAALVVDLWVQEKLIKSF